MKFNIKERNICLRFSKYYVNIEIMGIKIFVFVFYVLKVNSGFLLTTLSRSTFSTRLATYHLEEKFKR